MIMSRITEDATIAEGHLERSTGMRCVSEVTEATVKSMECGVTFVGQATQKYIRVMDL